LEAILSNIGWSENRRAGHHYMAHYHGERNHQGLGNRLLQSASTFTDNGDPIRQRERLGGMLNFYYREAA
jgi:putative transposase